MTAFCGLFDIYYNNMRFKNLILFLCVFFTVMSCCRKETLFVNEPHNVDLYVTIGTDIQKEVEDDIKSHLIYEWNKSDGKLFYSRGPEVINGEIFDSKGKPMFSKELDINKPNLVYLDWRKQYNIVLISSDNFESEPSDSTKNFSFTYKYDSIKQCEEIYAGRRNCFLPYLTQDILYLSNSYYSNEYSIDVFTEVNPITYIYIFQFIIYNDDENVSMNAISINYMGLSGVSKKYDLSNLKSSDELGVIESFKVKNIQYYDDYGVVAERFLTYGLYEDDKSSWNVANSRCELGVSLKMNDGSFKNGKVDITKSMLKKPHGGVINIVVKNSEISVNNNIDGDLSVDVENWQNNEFYIDF